MMKKKSKIKKIPDKKAKRPVVHQKRYFFSRWTKILFRLAAGLVIVYLLVGLSAGPGILKSDLEDKYGKVLGVVNVTVLVRGVPGKPVVSASTGCNGSNPYLDLDWNDDYGADYFDVWRNGAPLATGLTSSYYRDNNVSPGVTYAYYVFVTGPLGTKQSDEIYPAASSSCYVPPPPPPPPPPPTPTTTISIESIDKITNLSHFYCTPQTKSKKPFFTGITDILQGKISLEIVYPKAKRHILSNTTANINGYWSWRAMSKLKKGTYYLYVSATDPSDSSRRATDSLVFKVSSNMKAKTIRRCQLSQLGNYSIKALAHEVEPANLILSIVDENKAIHPGENLKYSFVSENGSGDYRLQILDDKKEPIFTTVVSASSDGGEIEISRMIPPGNYGLAISEEKEGVDVSSISEFQVKERPVLVLAPGREITMRQILDHVGWAAFAALAALAIFGILLGIEFRLARRSKLQVAEDDLKEMGMID